MAPPGTQPRMKAQKRKVVSVACQTDTPYHGSGCTSATPQPPCDEEYEDATVLRPGSEMTVMTDISTGDDDEVDGKDEDTLRISISRFSIMSETMCSKSKRIRGVPWRIMVMPKQHVVQKKQQKCMGFFLQCTPDKTYSEAWSCKADAEMRLVSQKPGISNFVRKTSHTYTSKENDWGYSCFMTWADVLDENQGYIKGDKVLMEIHVKPETPKNMMTREEFVKAIDQWYNLAEMQMARGQVDLALEANAQGLKFVKDKDEPMRLKMTGQKEDLVKKKVIDSITRIENHGTTAKTAEPLKPTSLRQALTGAQKTIVPRNGCKGPNKRADRKAAMQQIKKKKQELAAAKDSNQKKKSDSDKSDYSPSSPRYSFSSEEEHAPDSPEDSSENIDKMSSQERGSYDDPDQDKSKSSVAIDLVSSGEDEEEEEDDEDDEDDSDYYNEDDMMDEMCEHDSLHGSTSSLEESSIGNKVESSCQTEESGESTFPQPIPRRERRPAGKDAAGRISTNAATRAVKGLTLEGRTDGNDEVRVVVPQKERDRLTQYCQEHFGIDTMEQLFQELINELENNINQTMSQEYNPEGVCSNFFTKLDTLSDDHGTCCLAAGLCTVHARRILEGMKEFRRLIDATFKDEFQIVQRYIRERMQADAARQAQQGSSAPAAGSNTSGSASAAPSKVGKPADFNIDLQQDSAADSSARRINNSPVQNKAQQQQGSSTQQPTRPRQTALGGPACLRNRPPCDPTKPHPDTECEQSISKLLDEMGACKVYDLIAQKLEAMKKNDANKGLITLLSQLYQYFQALSTNSDQISKFVEYARQLHSLRASNTLPMRTQIVKDNEKRLAESEQLIKRLGQMHSQEQEQRKKLEEQLVTEENKLKMETAHAEQVGIQLRDARTQLKKTEKKAKAEENKNSTLLADKMDLEDKMKVQKKELEQLKKKATEERNKTKKEKDRDTETIRRLEAENMERETEYSREKTQYEERLKEARTKENKNEKEKKQMQTAMTQLVERARIAEAAHFGLLLDKVLAKYGKFLKDVEAGIVDAEENLKRARTQTDVEVMKKSVAEWHSVRDEMDKIIRLTKADYESAIELINRGSKHASQIEIQERPVPALPRVVRLPPVQVVQPSTAAIPPPHILPPPVGVIGQPRSASSRCAQDPQQQQPSPFLAGPSSSAMNSMKVSNDSPSQMPSLWSWSSPLGNVTEMFRAPSAPEPSRMHQQQQPTIDMWNGDMAAAQNMARPAYSNYQGGAPVSWANGWQAQQQQQQRNAAPNPQQPYNRPY